MIKQLIILVVLLQCIDLYISYKDKLHLELMRQELQTIKEEIIFREIEVLKVKLKQH